MLTLSDVNDPSLIAIGLYDRTIHPKQRPERGTNRSGKQNKFRVCKQLDDRLAETGHTSYMLSVAEDKARVGSLQDRGRSEVAWYTWLSGGITRFAIILGTTPNHTKTTCASSATSKQCATGIALSTRILCDFGGGGGSALGLTLFVYRSAPKQCKLSAYF